MPVYQVLYNTYQFPYCKVVTNESPKYAADGITLEGTYFDISVSGYLVSNSVLNFQTALDQMRALVTVPRETLLVQWSEDGVTYVPLINITPNIGANSPVTSDDAFGPNPSDVKITKFLNGRSCIYAWSVRAFQKVCWTQVSEDPETQVAGNSEILSITRRYQFDVDASGLTTRTISGQLMVRSQLVPALPGGSQPADNYRVIVTPTLPLDFVRARQSFTQSEDGRTLSFSFTDVEKKYVFPSPMTDGQANWMTHVEQAGALVRYNLSGWFSAPVAISKYIILGTIFNLISTKFAALGEYQQLVFDTRDITDDIYNNRISFSISAFQNYGTTGDNIPDYNNTPLNPILTAPPLGLNGQQAGYNYLTYPYGGDANRNSGVIGDPPIIYDECQTGTQGKLPVNPLQGNTSTSQNGIGTIGYQNNNGQLPTEQPNPTQSNNLSTAAIKATFTAYHERYSWEVNNNIVAFTPKVAGQANIIQQTGLPQVTFIQAGYATQVASTLNDTEGAPLPLYYNSTSWVMQISSVENSNPVPVGTSNLYKWTVNWKYVMRCVYAMSASDTPLIEAPGDQITNYDTDNNDEYLYQLGMIVL